MSGVAPTPSGPHAAADSATRLQAWRLETVDLFLRVLAGLQLVSMSVFSFIYVRHGSYGMPLWAGWLPLPLLVFGAACRRLPYRVRAVILMLPLLAASVLSFVRLGLAPAPTANGLAAVVLATVLLGTWPGVVVALVVLGAMLLSFVLAPAYAAPVPTQAFLQVLRVAPLVGLVVGVIALAVRRLSRALDDSVALVRRLEQEATERSRSELKLRGIFDLVPEAIALSRADDGVIIDVNPGFERLFGWKRSEVLGRAIEAVTVGDVEGRRRILERLANEGMLSRVEVRAEHRDGTPIDALFSLRIAELAGERVMLVVAQDVTEEKRLAAALRHAQRLDAMGDLAAGVAHNFNNALAAALPNVELALQQAPEPLRPMLEDARSAVRGAVDLARQMNMLARRERDVRRDPVDAIPVVREVVSMCERTFDKRIRIETDVRTASLVVPGPSSHLHQVLLNLCLNARDALDGRPQPSLRLEVDAAAGPVPGVDRSTAARHALLRIVDNGAGMSPDALAHIGEPFYTTKAAGHGTGLGLITAFGIVRDAGGRMTVASQDGVGTTFTVALPVVDGQPEPLVSSGAAGPQESRRVLLVDDDQLVRTAMVRQLEALGAAVVAVASGEEGIARAEAERFDVVLLDAAMPGLGGAGTLARLRISRPALPVIMMSGGADAKALAGADAVLQKPVSRGDLAEALAGVRRGLTRPAA